MPRFRPDSHPIHSKLTQNDKYILKHLKRRPTLIKDSNRKLNKNNAPIENINRFYQKVTANTPKINLIGLNAQIIQNTFILPYFFNKDTNIKKILI